MMANLRDAETLASHELLAATDEPTNQLSPTVDSTTTPSFLKKLPPEIRN